MPRRKVNPRKEIFNALTEHGKLTWNELERITGLSAGSLSKYLNIPYMEVFIERTVDTSTKPPTVFYSLKPMENGDIFLSKWIDFEDAIKEVKSIDYEGTIKGIVELEDPEQAINYALDLSYTDFFETMYHGAIGKDILYSTKLLNEHLMVQRGILWGLMVKFAKEPEWKERLDKLRERHKEKVKLIRDLLEKERQNGK
ncbi:MAG: hypothetical protein IAX21_03805 [Candidatus Bathyarchaeota archaeon]|nr:MAG: hypothetical protein IAX21_03805 [Candidatus Bathyarchaeota archaeon]